MTEKKHRIAIGSIFTESNHLSAGFTEYGDFAATELLRGTAVLRQSQSAVAGTVRICEEAGCNILPLLVASAYPGPPLSLPCYLQLRGELIEMLGASVPVDGVLLALHGSAAVEDIGDLEGDLIQAARRVVGQQVPIVVSLDMHGHVTPAMVRGANAIVAWETYPHRDTLETGMRGARLLLDTLDGKIRPAMAVAKVPLLASGIHGSTEGFGPMADLMRRAKALEGRGPIVSTSLFQVHPYVDLPGMGACAVVVTNNDPDRSKEAAISLAKEFWDNRERFAVETFAPADAIRHGLLVSGGPVLLVETADCVGGGAAGDSVATLRGLLDADPDGISLVPVVDPEAARVCQQAGAGSTISLSLGHKIDKRWGTPLTVNGEVARVSQGDFCYAGGIWQGKKASMGPSAVLRIGAIHILISTRPTYDWAGEQFESMGLSPTEAKFIVVKNPMNYRLAYADILRAAYILDTPGPTPATLEHIDYKRLEHPFYPQDRALRDVVPCLVQ